MTKLRLLVVDDELDKVRHLSAVLNSTGMDVYIRHESSANAARQCLRVSQFDMLIIDLNLPGGLIDAPSSEGGQNFFDLLCLDELANLPTDVIFITGREEGLDRYRAEANERGIALWQYRGQGGEWIANLVGRAKYVQKRLARDPARVKADIAIVTALRSPELESVLALDYNWSSKVISGDPTRYHFGELTRRDGRKLKVVAAHAQRKGMPSSAALAAKMAARFSPKYLVMLGICAGIEGKTNFGDVIVADPTWDYGSGKRALDATKSSVFLSAAYQMSLDPVVSRLSQELADNSAVLRDIRAGWEHDTPKGSFRVHVGPMASGASVIADDSEARAVIMQHREVVALEMEAYAVMAAAECAISPAPIAIVIKSVCDYANAKKNDEWQSYAAYTSAAFANQLFLDPSFNVGLEDA